MTARILLFDTETAPIFGYSWAVYDAHVFKVVKPLTLLSYAYKWLGDTEITTKGLCDYRGYKPGGLDDVRLSLDLWKLFDEADVIVAQNGDAYDIKVCNTRFLSHKMPPPSPYKTFDTLKALRKKFRFDSNKLDSVADQLGLGKKLPHTGKDLWISCMEGDSAAWSTMKRYNEQDVVLLENLYLTVRPWSAHPDISLYGDGVAEHTCPNCGSSHVQRRGTAVARTRRYQRLNCQDCGTWFQGAIEKT